MMWPDTNVSAVGAAGFESMSVSQPAMPVAGGLNVAGMITLASVPRRSDLPCTSDPELFFAESPSDVEDAKALCRDCPARIACFAGAVERREPWGVWGGELFLRGEVVPRKRPRGRPRKTEVAA
jgi:WhiB family redox-sensing transcriptional regulator